MTDPLTGVLSRIQFMQSLQTKVEACMRSGHQIGLLLLDIQRFRKINQRFGHQVADQLLKEVAKRLLTVCRSGDQVARIGDDQFALILEPVANQGHAELAALKIQRLLQSAIQVEDHPIRCRATIGVGVCPQNASTFEALLRSAEQALEAAKYQEQPLLLSKAKPHSEETEDGDLETALSEAITRSELRVFFQPKISLATGEPVGAEALVRWQHSSLGLLLPGAFLPMAESIGILKPLTNWMLNNALRLSSEWSRQWGKLTVSVNIPPRILAQPGFIESVIGINKLWTRDHVDLCLEILEQSLVSDQDFDFNRLNSLREAGIKIAIDDFGTGYSSLSYFRDIPVDELKIDRSFMHKLASDNANTHIVNLIIDLAHRFDLLVTAEGVEEKAVADYLKQQGCDQLQGFYIQRPMVADAFAVWLKQYNPQQAPESITALPE